MASNYKSKFEKQVAQGFKKAKIGFEYEPEVVRFVQPEKARKYTPDWRITTCSGDVLLVETKGKLTVEDRQKLVWVKEQHPKLNLVILFMNASVKIRKNSPTSYGEWATKNGFTWFDWKKGLPKEWT